MSLLATVESDCKPNIDNGLVDGKQDDGTVRGAAFPCGCGCGCGCVATTDSNNGGQQYKEGEDPNGGVVRCDFLANY